MRARAASTRCGGGSPYGMSVATDADGSRWPDEEDLAGARFQGERLAKIAIKMQG